MHSVVLIVDCATREKRIRICVLTLYHVLRLSIKLRCVSHKHELRCHSDVAADRARARLPLGYFNETSDVQLQNSFLMFAFPSFQRMKH